MSGEAAAFGTRELGAALTFYAGEIARALAEARLADPRVSEALDGVARIGALLTANPDVRLAVPGPPDPPQSGAR